MKIADESNTNVGDLDLLLKKHALDAGFDWCGIADIDDPTLSNAIKRYDDWLARGNHASMEYLVRHRPKKSDPRLFFEQAQSVLCVAALYADESDLMVDSSFNKIYLDEEKALVSLYTRYPDYHLEIEKKLTLLQEKIYRAYKIESKIFVDAQPMLDRFWGWRAGLGWIGKNSMLINRKHGSFFFIGGLLISEKVKADEPSADHCGRCTKCIDACPTNAINDQREILSDRCIGYHTIENKAEIPESVASKMGRWVAGCDICQIVCPWNNSSKQFSFDEFVERDLNPVYGSKIEDLLKWNEEEFKSKVKKFAMGRMKFSSFQRNIKIAFKNSKIK